ncbi:hypothetical protein [Pseudomarimonas salicorniae]|uniref:DUF1269 domain-containing protein n=1 Tax=Pseudomarimonas salicorniae TaxID=2933270 RepID=A0ABT0GML6_9GAMM|nr:hypothetical protein [Lysobacter sp. CAU 1642]MCK7595242.1 hypothetical protein [Lysobacter sp. CAU 1642]
MHVRHVYSASDLAMAGACVAAVRQMGITDDRISVFAREGVELAEIPAEWKADAPTDFCPGMLRGAAGGGGAGLLAGTIAMAIPALGVTVGGAALLGLAGSMIGAWAGALVGSALPSEVERRYRERIEAGELLVVVDAEEERLPELDSRMLRAGAIRLEFEQATVLS